VSVVPSLKTLKDRFGSFPGALYAAGVIDFDELLRRTKRHEYSLDELIDVLVDAMLECGSELTSTGYSRRRQRLREVPADKAEDLQVPTAATLANRLGRGRWEAAKSAALQARPSAATLIFAADDLAMAA
jgi:hypothetical protein